MSFKTQQKIHNLRERKSRLEAEIARIDAKIKALTPTKKTKRKTKKGDE